MPLVAILYFARTPGAEILHKQLAGAADNNLKLFNLLQERTLWLIGKSGLPCIHCDESAQHGDDFGTKLANALAAAFGLGYEQLIVIGNDCPGLSLRQIKDAAQLLQHAPMVAGRDGRGGAYLIGIQQSHFRKEDFAGLQWQTRYLLAGLRQYAPLTELQEVVNDLNRPEDLVVAVRALRDAFWLKRWLAALLATPAFLSWPDRFFNRLEGQSSLPLRAPPFAA